MGPGPRVEALGILTVWSPSEHEAASVSVINESLMWSQPFLVFCQHSIGNVGYEFL